MAKRLLFILSRMARVLKLTVQIKMLTEKKTMKITIITTITIIQNSPNIFLGHLNLPY